MSVLPARLHGLGPFGLVWSGQVITLIGTSTAKFAFVVRAWTSGAGATQVVLLSLATFLPRMLLSPTAGALVDRWNRRTVLLLADLGGFVAIGCLTLVYLSGSMRLWHIYVAIAAAGAAEAFQFPAFTTVIPQLVRKDQRLLANALMSSAKSIADICGPALGGLIVAVSGLGPVLVVDLVSFVWAIAAVWAVRLPDSGDRSAPLTRRPLAVNSLAGLRHLFGHRDLRPLMVVFFLVSGAAVFGFSITQAMILARTGGNSAALAVADVAIGFGGILGGLLLAGFGSPHDPVRGLLLGILGTSLAAQVAMAVVRTVPLWFAAGLVGVALVPLINGSVQAVLQSKLPSQVHGRVFGAFSFMSQIAALVAMCLSGPLADHVFEPQAAASSGVVGALAPLVGRGPGAGMATMLLIAGLGGTALAAFGLLRGRIRNLNKIVPDADQAITAVAGERSPG